MKTRFFRNNKGQVAIFIALMFQLLFLFFAMIVNVGLLVHHKINLQNSVDIAAYYGAMKQAEVLNAIAHVNYQIRQSWKLLVWRQKVLGTAGIDPTPRFPLGKLMSLGPNAVAEDWGGNPPVNPPGIDPTGPFRLATFCITYAPHEVAGSSSAAENSCKNMYQATQVPLPTANVLSIPGFFNFGRQVAAAITTAAQQAFNRCSIVGNLNFMVGGSFIASHYRDSEERSYLINHLATSLSQQSDDFFDLSGERVSEGLRKTLQKNLTAANNADVEIEIFNSMAAETCRQPVPVEGGNSPSWLVPIATYPVWRYIDCISNDDVGAGVIQTQMKQLIDSPGTLPSRLNSAPPDMQAAITELRRVLTFRRTIIGFEKDPWCVPYVGVKATARPRIPFMPLSGVEITSKGFAKPFGGRIGPWYVRDWPQGQSGAGRLAYKANGTNFQNDRLEAVGPIRVTSIAGINNLIDPAWAPNVARFVGDTFGFGSERLLAFFHRAIISPVIGSLGPVYQNLNPGPSQPFPMATDDRTSLRYYQDVAAAFTPNGTNDSLVWDGNAAPKLRLLEIAAIAPNLFDLAYYSIDPDFFNNYYLQIEQGIRRQGSTWDTSRVLLGDYGWRGGPDNSNRSKRFNIMDQVAIQNAIAGPEALNTDFSMPYANRNPAHLLNSWVVDSITDYSQNNQKFAKCLSPDSGPDDNVATSTFTNPLSPATPGNCVNGGRVGYSVKLVSKEWLTATDLELGGQGQTGAIRNPPPSDW